MNQHRQTSTAFARMEAGLLAKLVAETHLVVCSEDTELSEIADRMKVDEVGSVLVVDEERRPVGIITDRDVVMRALCGRDSYRELLAKDVLSPSVATVSVDETM